MRAVDNVTLCVGNTPMVELKSLSAALGVRILVKLEFLNPSGSVKDRAALRMLAAAIAEGATEVIEGETIFWFDFRKFSRNSRFSLFRLSFLWTFSRISRGLRVSVP